MKNYFWEFINCIFPFVRLRWANSKTLLKDKKIDTAIENKTNIDEKLDYMKGYKKLTLEDVKGFYDKTAEVKKSLEEKLKVSLFSVTVGVTILTSTISYLYQDNFSGVTGVVKAFTFFVASASIIYMIVAAFCAIKTISSITKVYQLAPEDLVKASSEDEKKELLAIYAERNSIMNIIRQNYMSVSYQCIVISLFLIAILFFTLGINSFRVNDKKRIAAIESKLNGLNNSVTMSKEDLSVFEKHVLDDRVNTAKSIQEIKDTLDDTIKTEEKLANEIYLNRQRIDSLELLLEKAKQCTQKDVNAD